jgi:L,D-transpeptidase-like protein
LIAVDPDGLATLIVVVSPRASDETGRSTTYLQNRGGYYVRAGRDNGRFETLSKGNGPNRARTNNDTPFGVYSLDHTRGDRDLGNPNQRTGTEGGTLSSRPRGGDIRYGTGIVYLAPVAGEPVDNGRAQIYFHGGGGSLGNHAFDAEQGLTSTHGCVRCQNEDVNTIVGAINTLDQGGDPVTHVFVGDADYLRSLAGEQGANGNWLYPDLRISMGYDQPSKEDRRKEKQRARDEANRQRQDDD